MSVQACLPGTAKITFRKVSCIDCAIAGAPQIRANLDTECAGAGQRPLPPDQKADEQG